MSERQLELERLQERLGYRFRRPELLERALTHRSYANEQGLDRSYERLEFLGDAVLNLATAERLFDKLPRRPEGELTLRKSQLVSARALAGRAEELGLGPLLRLGVGEERSGGRAKPSLLADALEAVLGAVFRDGGYEEACRVALGLIAAVEGWERPAASADAKTRLQELAQGRGWERPEYVEVASRGPDHAKRFTVECRLGERASGRGEAGTKKRAEQRAAAAVLRQLDGA